MTVRQGGSNSGEVGSLGRISSSITKNNSTLGVRDPWVWRPHNKPICVIVVNPPEVLFLLDGRKSMTTLPRLIITFTKRVDVVLGFVPDFVHLPWVEEEEEEA